jgi:hypothetical protein
MRYSRPSAGQAVYNDFIAAPETYGAAKRLYYALAVAGPVDRGLLDSALRQIVAHHESLRTSLEYRDGSLTQVIREPDEVTESATAEVEWHGSADEVAQFIYDMDGWWADPRQLAIRTLIGTSPAGKTLIVCAFNHACCDGMSAEMVIDQARNVYNSTADLGGVAPQQFSDYYSAMLDDGLQNCYGDWRRLMEESAPALPEGMTEQRQSCKRCWIRVARFQFDPETVRMLHKIARSYACTPFEALSACAGIYFRRSDRKPSGVGVVHSGRQRPHGFAVTGLLRSFVLDPVAAGRCRDARDVVIARREEFRARLEHFARLPFEEACSLAGIASGWRAGCLGPWQVELSGMYERSITGTMGDAPIGIAGADIDENEFCENGGPAFVFSFVIGADRVAGEMRFTEPPVNETLASRVISDIESVIRFIYTNPTMPPESVPAFYRATS